MNGATIQLKQGIQTEHPAAKVFVCIDDAYAEAKAEGEITEGAVGIKVYCDIRGERWNGLTKVLIISNEENAWKLMLVNGEATIPHEALIAGKWILFGVDGWNQEGTLRIPTILAGACKVRKSVASTKPSDPLPPSPDIITQILAAAGNAMQIALGVKNDADAGVFNGKPALIDPLTGNWMLWINNAYVDSGLPSRGEDGKIDPEQLRNAIEEYMREHPIDLPLASNTEFGIAKFSSNGFSFGSDGQVILPSPTAANITARLANRAVTLNKLDDCVKAAMADGKGAAWTEAEQTAARQRIGAPSAIEIKDDLSQLETAVNGKYSIPADGIPETDLSAEVQIKLNSGGGGGSGFKRIGSVTIDNSDTRIITFNRCEDGSPLDFNCIAVFLANATADANRNLGITANAEYNCSAYNWTIQSGSQAIGTSACYGQSFFYCVDMWRWCGVINAGNQAYPHLSAKTVGQTNTRVTTQLDVGIGWGYFGVGTNITVYGGSI